MSHTILILVDVENVYILAISYGKVIGSCLYVFQFIQYISNNPILNKYNTKHHHDNLLNTSSPFAVAH